MKRLSIISPIAVIFFITLHSCDLFDTTTKRPKGPSVTVIGRVLEADSDIPIPDVVISDGFKTVVTDNFGDFSFETTGGAQYIIMSVPSEYEIPLKDGYPDFYREIDTDVNIFEVDFHLTKLKNGKENSFTLLAVADPQIRTASSVKRLNNETIPDLINEAENHNTVYGVTLGDLVHDTFELFGDLKNAFLYTEIPFFHTIGNHDFDGKDLISTATQKYRSHFGPLDYSFNRGNVHIVVMNNVYNYTVPKDKWGFSKEQLRWLKDDLSHVSKDKMLIMCVHIPVLPSTTMTRKEEFINIISGYKEIHILSGHWHANVNYIDNNFNIYEHVTGAASGLWWSGIVNKCGAPNGYGVYEIEDNKMKSWYYKSTKFNKDTQIRMIAPYTFDESNDNVIANVWNADKDWKVELLENGISVGVMENYKDYSPEVYVWNKEKQKREGSDWYMRTNHLYRMKPNNSNSKLSIKATDKFGNNYYQEVAIRNVSSISQY